MPVVKINLIVFFLVLAAGLTALPLFHCPAPPISDLPSTAGRIWLEQRLWEGLPFETENFEFVLPPPYFLHDALILLATRVSGISPAAMILAADTLVWTILLIALVGLGRRLNETRALWMIPLIAGLLRWDFAGQFGNFAWRFGEMLLIVFYVYLILDPARPNDRRPAAAFWLAPLILYFAHAIAFAFWVLIVIVHAFSLPRAERSAPSVLHALGGCLLPAGYHLIRMNVTGRPLISLVDSAVSSVPEPYRWIPFNWEKLPLIRGFFPVWFLEWSVVLAVALALGAALIWMVSKKSETDRPHFFQISALYIAAALLPYSTKWPGASQTVYMHFANVRLLELAVLLSVPCVCAVLPPRSIIRWRVIFPGVVLVALVGQSIALNKYFGWCQDQLQKPVFGEWKSSLRPHRKFYSVVFPSLSVYSALHRYPHYAAEEGCYDPRLFIEEHFWVRPKTPWPVVGIYDTRIDPYERRNFADFYDDILIVSSPRDNFTPEYTAFWKKTYPEGEIVSFSQFARLFRKKITAAGLPAGPEAGGDRRGSSADGAGSPE